MTITIKSKEYKIRYAEPVNGRLHVDFNDLSIQEAFRAVSDLEPEDQLTVKHSNTEIRISGYYTLEGASLSRLGPGCLVVLGKGA